MSEELFMVFDDTNNGVDLNDLPELPPEIAARLDAAMFPEKHPEASAAVLEQRHSDCQSNR